MQERYDLKRKKNIVKLLCENTLSHSKNNS